MISLLNTLFLCAVATEVISVPFYQSHNGHREQNYQHQLDNKQTKSKNNLVEHASVLENQQFKYGKQESYVTVEKSINIKPKTHVYDNMHRRQHIRKSRNEKFALIQEHQTPKSINLLLNPKLGFIKQSNYDLLKQNARITHINTSEVDLLDFEKARQNNNNSKIRLRRNTKLLQSDINRQIKSGIYDPDSSERFENTARTKHTSEEVNLIQQEIQAAIRRGLEAWKRNQKPDASYNEEDIPIDIRAGEIVYRSNKKR